MEISYKALKTLQKVIKGWEVFEIVCTVIFFPWSLIYIAFRMVQEWDEGA